MKIAIIGGGMTGLSLAYFLSKDKKHEITIYEREKSVGGLLAGFTIEGTSLERFYHHIFRTDTDIIDLINEVGLGNNLHWHNDNTAIYHEGKIYPFTSPLDLITFSPLSFVSRIRTGIMALYLQRVKKWQKFESVTASKWLQKYFGKKAYEVLWLPILKGKFGDKYDQVSMAWLWARIHTRLGSKQKGDSSVQLGYLDGGFQQLVDEVVKRCEQNGVKILTGQNIDSLMNKENDLVIATVPNFVFAKLGEKQLEKEYINKLNAIEYCGAICLIVELKHQLTKYYWTNVNDEDIPFLALVEHTNMINKSFYGSKNILYLGNYLPQDHEFFTLSDDELRERLLPHLKKFNPNFDESWVENSYVFKAKTAQHVVTTNYKDKLLPYQTPLKNVYLSNFSQIYPEDRGTNFAVREAHKLYDLIQSS